MKYWQIFVLLLIAELGISQPNLKYHPARVLVKFATRADLSNIDLKNLTFNLPELDDLNQQNQLVKIHPINPTSGNDIFALEFQYPRDIPNTIYQYYNTRYFHYIEPDYLGYGAGEKIPNDPNYDRQWGLNNDGTFEWNSPSTTGADIDMQNAWGVTVGSDQVIVAILDSGLKLDHPEFQGRIWEHEGQTKGKDFADNDNDASDEHGHGTNVTSIALATGDNDSGFAGVNWNARIMPLRILDANNQGYYSWWASAIYFAADHGARVINMSVGGSSYSGVMEDAIDYATNKGAIVVAAMMNENNDVKYYPAAYEQTIAVGATSPDDSRSDAFPWNPSKGSNYGDHIDLCAPGNYIFGLDHNSNTNLTLYWSGTSQAVPHVSGVISLMLELDPDLTLESIRSILTNSAEDEVGRPTEDVAGWDQYHGHGRLNAFQALSSVQTTSVESQKTVSFSISPNPIRKGENLQIDFKVEGEKVISIFDATGRLIMMNKTDNPTYSVNAKNLVSGTYILKVKSSSTPISSKKFIVE